MLATCAFSVAQHLFAARENGGSSTCGVHPGCIGTAALGGGGCMTWKGDIGCTTRIRGIGLATQLGGIGRMTRRGQQHTAPSRAGN
jgi:hypothetical protein